LAILLTVDHRDERSEKPAIWADTMRLATRQTEFAFIEKGTLS
jgi:hypothetical protein